MPGLKSLRQMPRARGTMLGVLLLWQIFFADARICLPEAISEAQRQPLATLSAVDDRF